jgi:branched-subunit amino acid ABC-type transport system permease component
VSDVTTALPAESLSSRGLFIFLNIVTMGLYGFWFQYKVWRYLAHRQQRSVLPIVRAIFSIFFFHDLARSISSVDQKTDPKQMHMNVLYVAGLLLSFLPDPFWWLSFVSLVPLLRLHARASNLLWSNGNAAFFTSSFAPRHVFLVLLGMVFWYAWWTMLVAPAYPY